MHIKSPQSKILYSLRPFKAANIVYRIFIKLTKVIIRC